ncbi:MAG: OmpA family protein [Epsilonproteobacteria bacterium]|nr:OmpA family protein [Campylobacterota bacterium]
MKKKIFKPLIASSVAILMLAGCTATNMNGGSTDTNGAGLSKAQTGAIVGGLLGAVIGGVSGKKDRNKRIAIGAAAGAAVGAGVGYSLDRQAQEVAQVLDTNVDNSPAAEQDANKDLIVSNTDKYVKIMFRDAMMFPTNSAIPTPSAQEKIDRLTPVLQKYPNTIIQVVGHTDNRGTYEYNLKLSEARAKSVANSIKSSGIQNPIYARGCSFSKPIVPNTDSVNWALNRRVEVYLYPNQESVIDPCRN